MMPAFSFIYFDLDDTLLDHRGAEKEALADLFEAFPGMFRHTTIEEVQSVYHEINVDVWRRYGDGQISKERAKLERFELLVEKLNLRNAHSAEDLSRYYLNQYPNHWSFLPGALEAYMMIADHYPVGILTNGFRAVQSAKLQRFPQLPERASAIVISEEIGYMKPHPKIFEHATREAGFDSRDIMYVGDSYHSDVMGGLEAGWNVAWLHPGDDERLPDKRFQNWFELCRWLGFELNGA